MIEELKNHLNCLVGEKCWRATNTIKDMFFPSSVVSHVVPPYSIEDRIKAVNTRIPYEEMEKIATQIKIIYPD